MKNEKYLYSSINIVSMVLDNIQQFRRQKSNLNQSKLSIILLSSSDKFSTCLNWH